MEEVDHVEVDIRMGQQCLQNLYFVVGGRVRRRVDLLLLYFYEAVEDGGPSEFIEAVDANPILQ